MTLPSHWRPDDYGILNLHPVIDGREAHVWLRARQPYCDRGHWDWGVMGIGHEPYQPAHYFHHLEIGAKEIEAFVRRVQGESVVDPTHLDAGSVQHPNAESDWAWEQEGATRVLRVPSKEGEVALTLTPIDDLGGRVWQATVEGISSLDHADLFPRHYFFLEHAVIESEAFLAWRLLQRPAEHPGRLEEPLATQSLVSARKPPRP